MLNRIFKWSGLIFFDSNFNKDILLSLKVVAIKIELLIDILIRIREG